MTYTVLNINSSMNPAESKTEQMADYFISTMKQDKKIELVSRDLTKALPLIDQQWISAAFTPEQDRSKEQSETLTLSDQLIEEIIGADHLVLSVPMYNFSLPANVKAWFDQIARVGKTFKYTEQGPIGLIADKPVSLFVATGGTPINSPSDFLVPYLKQLFSFIGLNNVHIIVASDTQQDDINNHLQQLAA